MESWQTAILEKASEQQPSLNLDAGHSGVDVAAGTVDGERVGIGAALLCALVRHRTPLIPNGNEALIQDEYAALVETIDSLYDGDSNPCPACLAGIRDLIEADTVTYRVISRR